MLCLDPACEMFAALLGHSELISLRFRLLDKISNLY